MAIAGDRIFLRNDFGTVLVAQLNDDRPRLLAKTKPFRKLGRNRTVPVLANGRLYCRGGKTNDLACFSIAN
jgi:hypothetical protein